MLSTSYCTFAVVSSLKTASDYSLTIPETELFKSYLVEQKKVHKNHFLVLFHSAKSISNYFRTIKIFGIFFLKNSKFLYLLTPTLPRWRKVNSTKKHLWLLFHSAKSISYQFRTPKNFGIFFSKIWNFVFQTLYCIGEKSEINKKSFLVLFYSAKPISDHFRTLKNFEKFSKKFFKFLKYFGLWCLILDFLCFHQKHLVSV